MNRGFFHSLNRVSSAVVTFFTFNTVADVPTDTFAPEVTATETAEWELIGGYKESTNTLSIASRTGLSGVPTSLVSSELDGTLQAVNMNYFDIENYTVLDLSNSFVSGSVDISIFTKVISFIIQNNSLLTGATFPTSTAIVTTLRTQSCNLTSLNFSGLTNIQGTIQFYSNGSLTTVTNPTSSGVISIYWGYNCGVTGVLVLSGLTGLGGDFRVWGNGNMTSIANPISNQTFIKYYAYGCGLTSLNVSNFSNFGGDFRVNGNGSLTAITNSASTQTYTHYHAYGCGLTSLNLGDSTGLGGDIRLQGNSVMTTLTLPTSSINVTKFLCQSCDIAGLIISGFGSFSSNIQFNASNNNLSVTDVNNILIHLNG